MRCSKEKMTTEHIFRPFQLFCYGLTQCGFACSSRASKPHCRGGMIINRKPVFNHSQEPFPSIRPTPRRCPSFSCAQECTKCAMCGEFVELLWRMSITVCGIVVWHTRRPDLRTGGEVAAIIATTGALSDLNMRVVENNGRGVIEKVDRRGHGIKQREGQAIWNVSVSFCFHSKSHPN